MTKSAEKLAPPKKRKAGGRPFKKGERDPRQGNGPAKGAPNAGRPPDWWKAKMRELRDRWLVAAEAAEVIDDPNHPEWFRVGKMFHESVDGRPTTPIEVSVNKDLADALKLARDRAANR